jgi:hypothetical protein
MAPGDGWEIRGQHKKLDFLERGCCTIPIAIREKAGQIRFFDEEQSAPVVSGRGLGGGENVNDPPLKNQIFSALAIRISGVQRAFYEVRLVLMMST